MFVDVIPGLLTARVAKEGQDQSESQPNKSSEAAALLNLRVLLVEDDPVARKINKLMLEVIGCRVEAEHSGEDALSNLKNNAYDLLMLDIRLPGINGFEVARKIRSQPETKNIPIVALSALTDIAEECALVGINIYLTKPVVFDELRQTLIKLLT